MLKCLQSQIALAAVLASVGCTSIKSKPVAADTPAPPHTSDQLCARDENGKLHQLAPGQQCLAPVTASFTLSRIPISVQPYERYCVHIPQRQAWYDASNLNVPPGGSKGSLLMNTFQFLRRHGDADWFVLFGAVVAEDAESSKEYSSSNLETHPCFDIPRTDGPAVLAFYPNDAYGFYWNNSGRIWIWVSRQASSATSSTRARELN
jgi:hypothetical protein